MKPRLTVLMPVFNAEKFLFEAVESILNQTFADFEFLIIDDASIDSSAEIVASFKDSRIRLIKNKENAGISAALNKGIEISQTDLIARMDADDISYPSRLEKQFAFFEANPECALLSAWAREIDADKKPILTEKWASAGYYYNLTFECRIYHPTVMYRRAAVKDCGMYSRHFCEDYDLWWKISRKYKIDNLEEVLLDYRSTGESLSRVAKKNEYKNAQTEQVLRNIRYYTNGDFTLSSEELEALRYNLEPLLKAGNLNKITDCFENLDYITGCIVEKENVNRDETAIREAAKLKRELMLSFFERNLPKTKAVNLLMRLGEWKRLFNSSGNYLLKKIK
jgi:glycosyltransferase involved in cell wall biosynthesis